jgi:transposase
MTKKKYKRYSPEFKRHALKKASEDGMTDKVVCDDLGISPRQLRRWRDQYRLLGDEAFPGQGRKRDDEVAELKRKLARAEQERDFLKDAAVFFARESK